MKATKRVVAGLLAPLATSVGVLSVSGTALAAGSQPVTTASVSPSCMCTH
jgi:hypothetical protein